MQTTSPVAVVAKSAKAVRKVVAKAKTGVKAKGKVAAKTVAKAKAKADKPSRKDIQKALNAVADGMAKKFLKNKPIKAKSTRDGAILTLDNGDVVTISVTTKKAAK